MNVLSSVEDVVGNCVVVGEIENVVVVDGTDVFRSKYEPGPGPEPEPVTRLVRLEMTSLVVVIVMVNQLQIDV